MPYNDKNIKKSGDGAGIAQIFNPILDEYEPLMGEDGSTYYLQRGTVVIDSFSTTGNSYRTYTGGARGVAVVNDGQSDVNIEVNGFTVVVKPGEAINEVFKKFNAILFNSTSNYRVLIKE